MQDLSDGLKRLANLSGESLGTFWLPFGVLWVPCGLPRTPIWGPWTLEWPKWWARAKGRGVAFCSEQKAEGRLFAPIKFRGPGFCSLCHLGSIGVPEVTQGPQLGSPWAPFGCPLGCFGYLVVSLGPQFGVLGHLSGPSGGQEQKAEGWLFAPIEFRGPGFCSVCHLGSLGVPEVTQGPQFGDPGSHQGWGCTSRPKMCPQKLGQDLCFGLLPSIFLYAGAASQTFSYMQVPPPPTFSYSRTVVESRFFPIVWGTRIKCRSVFLTS